MNLRHFFKNLAMPLALLVIVGFFGFKLDRDGLFGHDGGRLLLRGPRNLTQLFIEFSIVATLALGMFMVILTGQIDLSVGSGVGLIGGISAVLVFHHNWPAPWALLGGLVAALVVWGLIGTLIVKQRIPSFVIKLGWGFIF